MAAGRAALAADDARALATGTGDGLVVLAGGQLYRLPGAAPAVRLGAAPAGASALASTDGRAARLWVARGPDVLAGDGSTWRVAARVDQPVDHLVGSAHGWLAWASGNALTIAQVAGAATGPEDPGGSARTFLSPARIRALAACGADLLILADDGLHVAAEVIGSTEAPTRVAGPLAGERLACGPDPRAPWLVIGPGLLVSTDRGRRWRSRAGRARGPPGRRRPGVRPDLAAVADGGAGGAAAGGRHRRCATDGSDLLVRCRAAPAPAPAVAVARVPAPSGDDRQPHPAGPAPGTAAARFRRVPPGAGPASPTAPATPTCGSPPPAAQPTRRPAACRCSGPARSSGRWPIRRAPDRC